MPTVKRAIVICFAIRMFSFTLQTFLPDFLIARVSWDELLAAAWVSLLLNGSGMASITLEMRDDNINIPFPDKSYGS
jgi:hypothetical protein